MAKKPKLKDDDRYEGAHIKCLKCQMKNSPERVFCETCGAKLPLGGDPFTGVARRRKFKPGMKFVSNLITLFLLVCITLTLWPAAEIGVTGDDADRRSYLRKVDGLIAAIEENRRMVATFDEQELNAFMADRVARLRETAAQVQYAGVSLSSELIKLQLKTKVGPISLTRSLSGRVLLEDNDFSFEIEKSSVGVLPLPRSIGKFLAPGFERFFSGLEPELMVVDRMSRIETVEGRVRLMVN